MPLIEIQLPVLEESWVPSAYAPPASGVIVGGTVFATASPQSGFEAPEASASGRVLEPVAVMALRLPPTAYTISSPPGAQLGEASVTALLVSGTRPEPSAFITNSSAAIPVPEMNAIFDPSGDHAGSLSTEPVDPSFCAAPPDAGATAMSLSESTKTISVPSGAHAGLVPVPKLVSVAGTQAVREPILTAPPLTYATFVPSGEIAGSVAPAQRTVEAPPEAGIERTSTPSSKTISWPSLENETFAGFSPRLVVPVPFAPIVQRSPPET